MKNRITALLGIIALASSTFAGDTAKMPLNGQGIPSRIDIEIVNAPLNLSTAYLNETTRNAFVNRGADEKMTAKPISITANFAKSGDEITFQVANSEAGAFEANYKLVTATKTDNMKALIDGGLQRMLDEYAGKLAKRNTGTSPTRSGGSPKQ